MKKGRIIMDENNIMDSEKRNDFVLVPPEETGNDNPQPEMNQEETIGQEEHVPQTEEFVSQAEERVSQAEETVPEPRPMPSQDNIYRFQNIEPEASKQKKVKREKKSHMGITMPRIILSAVVFGVVAAACFLGVQQISNFVFGRDEIAQVGSGDNSAPISITTASGVAVSVNDVSGIVERVMPSIVAITEKSTQTSYFGQTYSSQGAGSGFIVKQDNDQLLIVTNNHVVADADKISITFNDNEVADATVKGTSASNDLAVLTVPLNKLKDSTKKSIRVASLGSSDNAKVGQMVIAIGNALGYGQSVTVGYLSAKDREVSASDSGGQSTTQILLQTDAAINPGNSGGALIDTNGNVIGINSSKYFTYNSTNVEGMGYAIPMSSAVSIINDLMDREVLKEEEKGYLGITGRNISETISKSYGIPLGVYVAAVSDTGAAYKAGIKQGDIITKIDGTVMKTIEEVQGKVNSTKTGTTIKVTIMRSDDGSYKEREVDVTLKGKDTVDGLEDSTTQEQPNDSQNYGDDSEIVPWGRGIY